MVVTDTLTGGPIARFGGDDGDNVLETGESWIYVASYTILNIDDNPLLNTLTVVYEDQNPAKPTPPAMNTAWKLYRSLAPGTSFIYLPILLGGQTTPTPAPDTAPDLVVESLTVSGSGVQVIIRNQGDGPVAESFWVDLYVDPNPVPTGVNQTWKRWPGQSRHFVGCKRGSPPLGGGRFSHVDQ